MSPIDQVDIMRLLLADPSLEFETIRTVGRGLSARMVTEQMANKVVSVAALHGWICTRKEGPTISVESGQPTLENMFMATTLYHVSELQWRKQILKEGLIPTSGGNTSLQRAYANRLHLAVKMRDAFSFIHHQIKPSQKGRSGSRRDINVFDLYEVPVESGFKYCYDDHFDGSGIWIANGIPATGIALICRKSWVSLYRSMYPDDF